MRWAFWRRKQRAARPDPLSAATWPPPDLAAAGAAGRSAPDEPEERRSQPAFSGAEPLPGQGHDSSLLPLAEGSPGAPSDLGRDLTGTSTAAVALVRAAAARDGAAADEVVQALGDSSDDGLLVAVLALLVVLGERLVAAAGHELDAGPEAGPEVVAQGETVARRAAPLLRAVAPDAPSELVLLAVRCGAGVLVQDPVVGHLVDQPMEDLALVTAALLAQTVADGQGSVEELAEELAELLPG